jgi:hypothetical protein
MMMAAVAAGRLRRRLNARVVAELHPAPGSKIMSRSVLPVLLLAIFAGDAAGAAVSIVLRPDAANSAAPAVTRATDARLDDLRDTVAALEMRIEELKLADSEAISRMNRLEEEEQVRSERGGQIDESTVPGVPGLPPDQVRLGGAPFIGFGAGRGAQLMGLSEEEKWTRLREELALDSYQEGELKRIQQEMQAEIKDIFKIDPETGTLAGKLDVGKIMEARKNADERVKNLLSEQQYEKYRQEGYANALGTGGGVEIYSTTSISTPRERQGK